MAQQAALADELSALNERGGSYEAELSAKRKAQSGLLRQRMQLEKEQKRLQQKQQKKVCCPRRVASGVGGVAVLMPPFMPSFLRSSPKAEGHGSGVGVSSACLRLWCRYCHITNPTAACLMCAAGPSQGPAA